MKSPKSNFAGDDGLYRAQLALSGEFGSFLWLCSVFRGLSERNPLQARQFSRLAWLPDGNARVLESRPIIAKSQ